MIMKSFFKTTRRWYNVFDHCTEENRLQIMMLAVEKQALDDFQEMMRSLESDISPGPGNL